jgi:hypothetical protein
VGKRRKWRAAMMPRKQGVEKKEKKKETPKELKLWVLSIFLFLKRREEKESVQRTIRTGRRAEEWKK